MPSLTIRKSTEVPNPAKVSRAVREQQQLYEGFVRGISGDSVGELVLDQAEGVRAIKVRLRRAATRLRQEIQIWDANGRVYFSALTTKRRERPRKQP